MSHVAQAELGLPEVRPVAGSLPVALYRSPDRPGEVTGFAVRLGSEGPMLQFRWRRPRSYEPQAPLALGSFGDRELASVRVDDLELGRATPMQALHALLDQAPWRHERSGDLDVRAVRALLDGAPSRHEHPLDVEQLLGVDALTLCSPAERERRRRGLLATLAGCAAPVIELLARQGLLEAAWAPGFDWRRALAEHRRLAAEGGREAFLLLALVPPHRLPAKGLASRLAHIDEPALTAAFVRAAAGMRGEGERALFEETLETALTRLMRRWRDTGADPGAPVVAHAFAHLMSIAERVAFARTLVDARTALPPADARFAFTLPARYAALRRPAHRPEEDDPVRPARLHAWAVRCAQEFARAALASPLLLEGFRHQCNEALDAVVAGHWSRDDLRRLPWPRLVRPVWRSVVPDPPVLPQAHWPCELPPGAQPLLRDAGLDLRPIACTGDLLAEAAQMDNCLASSTGYFDELRAGRTRIFAVSGTRLRATLQLTRGEDGWFVEQVRGRGNLPFEEAFARSPHAPWPALRAFVAQFALARDDARAQSPSSI